MVFWWQLLVRYALPLFQMTMINDSERLIDGDRDSAAGVVVRQRSAPQRQRTAERPDGDPLLERTAAERRRRLCAGVGQRQPPRRDERDPSGHPAGYASSCHFLPNIHRCPGEFIHSGEFFFWIIKKKKSIFCQNFGF